MAKTTRDPQARERLVEVARRAVAELGVRGATVRGIAARAEVSTGYVMHYFADKRQLAEAVLAANNRAAGARVTRASAQGRGLAALEAAVEALLPLDAARRLEWQVWVAFWAVPVGDDAGSGGLADGRTALAAILTRPLADAVEDGELPASLDLAYETERLMTLAAGLGLTAGGGSPTAVRRLAHRMLADHIESLRRSA
jgi:AcrR family transcriptional regulator